MIGLIEFIDTPSVAGRTSFQARVTKPGTHSWLLELSAEKPTSMDEAAADYEAVSLGQSQSLLNSPSGETVVRKDVRVRKAGGPGPRTITLTIRVEANGQPPAEVTRDYSYEVFKKT